MTLAGVRLGAVRLRVSDLERSVRWYRDILGLIPTASDGLASREASLRPADGAPLIHLVEAVGAAPHPPRGRLGLFHFALLLPDRASLGRFLVHARASGIPLGAADHIVSEALYLNDPDGLGIEVYADRPREAWQSDGSGRIRMATLPLDADSLAAAAGGRAMEGAPAGTRLGHVHLHVGNLAEAEAFYAELIGLPVTTRGYPGALFLGADGYHHHLGVNTWAGSAAVPPGDADACLLEWDLGVADRGAWTALRERVRVAGGSADAVPGAPDVRARGDAVAPSHGDPASISLTDPWGTRVRLRGF